MTKALLLDVDGRLVDTESVVLRAWEEEYARHGLSLDRVAWLHKIGSHDPRKDRVADLAELVADALDHEQVRSRVRAREHELGHDGPLRDGVLACADEALALGLRLAVVSSSPLEWVGGHLGRLGLLDRMEVLVTRSPHLRSKPAPDLYLEALRLLDLPPADCLAVEDSANGVAAARAAGLRVVAVPGPVTAGQELSEADHVLASFGELFASEVWLSLR